MSAFTTARYMFRPRRSPSGESVTKYKRKAVFELPCHNRVKLLTVRRDNDAVFSAGSVVYEMR